MNFTEGFGKKWIDRILGKVDKDQGVANAGKVLGIGADGQVVPVAQSGGGSGEVLFEKITPPRVGYLYYNHNLYNSTSLKEQPIVAVLKITPYAPNVTINSIDEANSVIHVALENGNSGSNEGRVRLLSGYAKVLSNADKTVEIWCEDIIRLSVSASITIGADSGYLYIRGPSYIYNQRQNTNNFYYYIDKNSIIFIRRTGDRKEFTVIVDNLNDYEKNLRGECTLLGIYAPPNVISTEPFPDAPTTQP